MVKIHRQNFLWLIHFPFDSLEKFATQNRKSAAEIRKFQRRGSNRRFSAYMPFNKLLY